MGAGAEGARGLSAVAIGDSGAEADALGATSAARRVRSVRQVRQPVAVGAQASLAARSACRRRPSATRPRMIHGSFDAVGGGGPQTVASPRSTHPLHPLHPSHPLHRTMHPHRARRHTGTSRSGSALSGYIPDKSRLRLTELLGERCRSNGLTLALIGRLPRQLSP